MIEFCAYLHFTTQSIQYNSDSQYIIMSVHAQTEHATSVGDWALFGTVLKNEEELFIQCTISGYHGRYWWAEEIQFSTDTGKGDIYMLSVLEE